MLMKDNWSLQTVVVTQNQVSCRLAEHFERPDEFVPERWLRGSAEHRADVSPYLVLPFGHGPRTCIARRLAEQNMLVFLVRVRNNLLRHPIAQFDITYR